LAILFVVVTVTLTSLGRSNAAFYAATGNTGNAFTAGHLEPDRGRQP
jgi:hypothetical protein